jgi:RNA polymerase primary sigma factor
MDFLPDHREEQPLERANRELLRSRIREALDVLSWRERSIIELRFGLGDGYSYTLTEIGQIFQVSRERVRQLEVRAFEKLQQAESSQKLCGFLDPPVLAMPATAESMTEGAVPNAQPV